MITSCIRQLQYFKRALVSWNENQFHQTAQCVSFNYFKTASKGINSGLQMFWMLGLKPTNLNFGRSPLHNLELHNLEQIVVTRSVHQKMLLTKEVVKLIKNNNCFNIAYKFD